MNKKEFDEIIKMNIVSKFGADNFVYRTVAGKNYENYYSNSAFDDFVEEMKTYKSGTHFNEYHKGNGGELKEKKGRYGFVPPKMASVASSSRFCYLALRNGGDAIGGNENVRFEVGCKIKGIDRIPPQLDAYFYEKNIYVEAKCHEIFDSHKAIFDVAYWNLIYGENNQFGFDVKEKSDKDKFEIPLAEFGFETEKTSIRFDIKQFLCHIMGIASQKNIEKQVKLVYLFFKPKTDDVEINKKIDMVFNELKTEIDFIFGCKPIKTFTQRNNIKLIAVAEYDEVMQELTDKNIISLSLT